ncbi:hypothetical protein AX774_g2696 [Zancudomyces culisetae]|uniref:Transcriptional repressor OPI1 n=1 Tax=Zancudomyces culisetae TaxID=1213189 RepID=A0A1R1PS65_ZANCU|nr:hypothetical protein AX774_g2696 [Zancudomyces culisetae]|eukprot:OMH83791.1 hypothetical protein AX774_g2696 [Zancudomyces culisetae]
MYSGLKRRISGTLRDENISDRMQQYTNKNTQDMDIGEVMEAEIRATDAETAISEEEEQMLVAEALGSLKGRGSSNNSNSNEEMDNFNGCININDDSEYTRGSSNSNYMENENNNGGGFIQRVAEIPMVNAALNIYDRSKQSSTLMRYGAGAIESGVRTMCNPIVRRLDVKQIDDFACKQLDRLHTKRSFSKRELAKNKQQQQQQQNGKAHAWGEMDSPMDEEEGMGMGMGMSMEIDREAEMFRSRSGQELDRNETVDARINDDEMMHETKRGEDGTKEGGKKSMFNTWKQLKESARIQAATFHKNALKRINYCLEWLQYAIETLEQTAGDVQTLIDCLRKMIEAAFQGSFGENKNQVSAVLYKCVKEIQAKLVDAHREVIKTVRAVIKTLSQYAGAVLPAETRNHVRSLILALPRRWDAVNSEFSQTSSIGSASAAASPVLGSDFARSSDHENVIVCIENDAKKLVAFATESATVLNHIHSVFYSIYSNAELWLAPQHSTNASTISVDQPSSPSDSRPYLPPISKVLATTTSPLNPNKLPSISQTFTLPSNNPNAQNDSDNSNFNLPPLLHHHNS